MTVWGHAQPHHSRPNAVVKMMIDVRKTSIATAKRTVSSGQKMKPRMENFRSTMFSIRSGLPRMRTKGPATITASSSQENHVRWRWRRPEGFLG